VRIVYCSSGAVGRDMMSYLYSIPGEFQVVAAYTANDPIRSYPAYDLGVSFLYTHKIHAEHVTAHEWVNFHPGPLPEMRGRNLAYHAIIEKRKEFGATIHYMDASFDTGDIIECRRFPILDADNAGDLVIKSRAVLADLFMEYMPRIIAGEDLPVIKQGEGNYYMRDYIGDEIELSDEQQLMIRAVTVPGKFYARALVGGVEYRIVPQVRNG